MVIKGNGAVNTMEAVKINTKEKERTKVTYHKSVFSSVLTGITWGAAILALAVLVFLVGFILIRGVKNLTLEQFAWTYNTENVTMLPAIINTVTMTVLSLLLAAPLGIFSAIYLYPIDCLRFVRYAVFYENPENGILDDVRCLYTCHHDSSADYANSRRSLKIGSGFLSGSKLWTGSRKASYDF